MMIIMVIIQMMIMVIIQMKVIIQAIVSTMFKRR